MNRAEWELRDGRRSRATVALACALLVLLLAPTGTDAAPRVRVKNLQPISGANPFPNASHAQGDPKCSRQSDATSQESQDRRDLEREATLAVNPRKPRNIVATWIQGNVWIFQAAYTKDRGKTWRRATIPFHPCTGGPYYGGTDPGASFRPDGVATLMLQPGGHAGQNPVPFGQAMVRSSNGGRTWSSPAQIQALDGFHDRQRGPIAWDANAPKVGYVGWMRAHDDWAATGLATGYDLYFASTADGGKSWTQPRPIYETTGPGFALPHNTMHVLSDGSVVNTFVNYHLENVLTGVPEEPNELFAIRSTDNGATWSEPVRIAETSPTFVTHPDTGEPFMRFAHTPSMYAKLSPDGTIYVVWTDIYSTTSSRILLARSSDGGQTWGEPQTVASIDSQAFLPAVAATRNGTLGITWYDFRRDQPGDNAVRMDYWFAYSRQGSGRWRQAHVGSAGDVTNARQISPEPGTDQGRYIPTDFGDIAPLGRGFATVFDQYKPKAKIGNSDIAFARIVVRPRH